MKEKRRFKSDLVPVTILVARYFVAERDALERLDNQLATLGQQLDEMREEHCAEEGLLAEANSAKEGEKAKITAKILKAALMRVGKDADDADERAALETYEHLLGQQSKAKARRKAAQEDLDRKIDAKYPKLTEAEIKMLVVDDKWLAQLSAAAQCELDRVSQTLTGRIRQLAERYATPLPKLNRRSGDARRPGRRASEEHGSVMEVKAVFKQTEVGVFPEDWEEQDLSSLVATGPKNGYSGRSAKGAHGTPTLSLGATTSGSLVLNDDTVKRLDETIDPNSELFLQSGDVLVQRSNTLDLVGTTAVFDGPSGVFVYPDLMMRMRFRENATAHWFWRYANSANGRRFFMAVAAGSSGSMPKISGDRLRRMLVPVPPLFEQRAVATALSDVDALLNRIDRLIAKKRDLKQAAMQQLLTAQTSLPGFHGEWEVKRLGDHVTFLRNGTNSRAELTQDDPVKYLHYGDVHACVATQLHPNALPSLPSERAKSLARLQDGDLVFADASEDLAGVSKSVEMRGAAGTETVPGLHTIAARFDKSVLADGFKSYLQFCPTFFGQLRRLAAGTKVYATNRAHIASIEMRLPSVEETNRHRRSPLRHRRRNRRARSPP